MATYVKRTSNEKIKLAAKIKKLWDSGRFKTRGDLADHLDLPYQLVQKSLKGRLLNQGTVEQPEGDCRSFVIYGKTFFVYSDGRIWSVESNKLVGFTHKSGYKMVGVINPATDKLENLRVSRLMLTVFIRKPKKGEWARHLDNNPENNTLKNLAWGKPQDNSDDCVRNGNSGFGEKNCKAKLTERVVKRLVKSYNGEPYKTFAREFVAKYNLDINELAIVRILRGQSWTAITGLTGKLKQR